MIGQQMKPTTDEAYGQFEYLWVTLAMHWWSVKVDFYIYVGFIFMMQYTTQGLKLDTPTIWKV
jgi:hypothetical protein